MRSAPFLLILLLLAGCAAPAGDNGDDAPAPARLAFTTTDCAIAAVLFLLPFEHVAARLPEGFSPADAQPLVGAPAPIGRGGILVEAYECADHSLAGGPAAMTEVSLLVEAPGLEGPEGSADLDFYQPFLGTTGPARDELARIGWHSPDVRVVNDILALPTASSRATLEIADGAGVLMTATLASPAPAELAGTFRFWQVQANGTSHIDYTFSTAIAAGSVDCALRAGGVIAEATGITACTPGEALGVVVPSVDMAAVGGFYPGVRAT